jgi:hypothetical protein
LTIGPSVNGPVRENRKGEFQELAESFGVKFHQNIANILLIIPWKYGMHSVRVSWLETENENGRIRILKFMHILHVR